MPSELQEMFDTKKQNVLLPMLGLIQVYFLASIAANDQWHLELQFPVCVTLGYLMLAFASQNAFLIFIAGAGCLTLFVVGEWLNCFLFGLAIYGISQSTKQVVNSSILSGLLISM